MSNEKLEKIARATAETICGMIGREDRLVDLGNAECYQIILSALKQAEQEKGKLGKLTGEKAEAEAMAFTNKANISKEEEERGKLETAWARIAFKAGQEYESGRVSRDTVRLENILTGEVFALAAQEHFRTTDEEQKKIHWALRAICLSVIAARREPLTSMGEPQSVEIK